MAVVREQLILLWQHLFNKGVFLCEKYFGKIKGEMFAEFTHKKATKVKIFLQAGDPSPNSRKANNAMQKLGLQNSVYQRGALTKPP